MTHRIAAGSREKSSCRGQGARRPLTIYPTSLRANGSGWELGIGRVGSIVGPLVGALFVGLSVQRLYMWSALPFAVGAVVCFIVHRLNTSRLAAHPELREAQ